MLPDNEEKLAKICKWVRLCHMRTLIKWAVYAVLAYMAYKVVMLALLVFIPETECPEGASVENEECIVAED